MRIVFMGNPGFAVPSLSVLLASGYDVVAVVSNPDKEQGRGRRPRPTPVASFAAHHGLTLIQPAQLDRSSVVARLAQLEPDLFVVVAFRILPEAWLRVPKLGSVNLHASLLPKYRGAAPIHWAIMNGDSVTGLTTFILAPTVDTGDMVMRKRIVVLPDDTFGSLSHRMSRVGAALLRDTVALLESGKAHPVPQTSTMATKAPKITSSLLSIAWERHARDVHNRIRALAPSPGAFTMFRNRRLKILKTRLSTSSGNPGEIISVGKGNVKVACGWGAVDVLEVQLEGRQRMGAREFLSGTPVSVGEKFGDAALSRKGN
ncbi:MAG: methionyl-tRNA formyltransferase [Fidelibacterota bacterium]